MSSLLLLLAYVHMPSKARISLLSLKFSSVSLYSKYQSIPDSHALIWGILLPWSLQSLESKLAKDRKERCTMYKLDNSIPPQQEIKPCNTIRPSCCFYEVMLFRFSLTLKCSGVQKKQSPEACW